MSTFSDTFDVIGNVQHLYLFAQGGATEPPIVPEFNNCEVLHDTLQLSWKVDNSSSSVRFRLCGCTATDARSVNTANTVVLSNILD